MSNELKGTVVYMAPELIAQERYDTSVDIWSFGILAIEIGQRERPNADVFEPEEMA